MPQSGELYITSDLECDLTIPVIVIVSCHENLGSQYAINWSFYKEKNPPRDEKRRWIVSHKIGFPFKINLLNYFHNTKLNRTHIIIPKACHFKTCFNSVKKMTYIIFKQNIISNQE
jgi:hypothetical protein